MRLGDAVATLCAGEVPRGMSKVWQLNGLLNVSDHSTYLAALMVIEKTPIELLESLAAKADKARACLGDLFEVPNKSVATSMSYLVDSSTEEWQAISGVASELEALARRPDMKAICRELFHSDTFFVQSADASEELGERGLDIETWIQRESKEAPEYCRVLLLLAILALEGVSAAAKEAHGKLAA